MNHATEIVCKIADSMPQGVQDRLIWSHIKDVAKYYASGDLHVRNIERELQSRINGDYYSHFQPRNETHNEREERLYQARGTLTEEEWDK